MTKGNAYQALFKEINHQLEAHQIIVKKGALVEASVIDTPLKPKGKTNYEVIQDRKDEKEIEVKKSYADRVDTDASWPKKGGKYRFGYKKHYVTDDEGLVLGVVTTKARTNEIPNLEEVLEAADLPEHIPLKADKGYQSSKNEEILKKRKLKNHILKKSKKRQAINPLGKEVQQIGWKDKV